MLHVFIRNHQSPPFGDHLKLVLFFARHLLFVFFVRVLRHFNLTLCHTRPFAKCCTSDYFFMLIRATVFHCLSFHMVRCLRISAGVSFRLQKRFHRPMIALSGHFPRLSQAKQTFASSLRHILFLSRFLCMTLHCECPRTRISRLSRLLIESSLDSLTFNQESFCY